MSWRIVSSNDRNSWASLIAKVACDDPYFCAEYHDAYSYDGGYSLLYAYEEGQNVFIHVFRMIQILKVGSILVPDRLFDIESVYGYTGPLSTTIDIDFLRRAWNCFSNWTEEQQVVSEFCRFHPILQNCQFCAPEMSIQYGRETVAIPLATGEKNLWSGYNSTQRNRVRKALGSSLCCKMLSYFEGISIFVPIYEKTMNSVSAAKFYYFPYSYYQSLASLGCRIVIFAVYKNELAIAAAIFLVGKRTVYYHLGGSLPEYRTLAPNNLLFHTAAIWAMDWGADHLFLGGGRTNDENDELLRFKKKFTGNTVPFYIGKRIWRRDCYTYLSNLWSCQSNSSPPPILQHYRIATY